MIALDANSLVHYLVTDHPEQAPPARELVAGLSTDGSS